jgi:outer membrane protein assembly factor BamA
MFKKTLIAAVLAVAATSSFAQYYAQGAIGQGNVDIDCGSATNCKKGNTGYKLLVGAEQGNGLAYEAQMISYGKVTIPGNSDYTVSGFGGNVALSAPINDKFGYRVAAGLGLNKANAGSTSTTKLQLALGGSIAYNINKTTAVSFDYDVSSQKYNNAGTSLSGPVSLMSIGLRAKF